MRNGAWKFYAALTLFVAWVGVLTFMAIQSGEKPRTLPPAAAPEG